MKRQSSGDNTGNFKSQDALMQDKMKYELKRYEKLHKLVIKSLEEYLIMLKNAKFQELSDTLTQPIIHTIAMTLSGNQFSESKLNITNYTFISKFEKYKETFFSILDGIQQAQNLKTNNNQQHATILDLQEQSDILTDIEKLKEYINTHYSGQKAVLFEINTELNVAPVIYPHYLEYIKRHGLPENSVWDSEKMAIIILELLNEGVITQSDIFL
ncbi:MAG: hypothetical protein CBC91_00735 [Rickettsiales bacterium TMED131]|nr:MAG: hypothetical protein CBC91_00735 [Rickettsiales bacterium TMED131]|tara:strand:- start:304 stop:945 length:642 start_codon:yes stop_codon:yes gene_type:complete